MFWHWIRRQYRLRGGRPIFNEKESDKWHNISTAAYVLVSWTFMGYIFIKLSGRESPFKDSSTMSSAEYYGSLFEAKDLKVIKMQNFQKVGEAVFKGEDFEKALKEEQQLKEEEFYGEN